MDPAAADHHMLRLAAGQHGAIARRQLRALGIDDDLVRRRVRTGRFHVVSSRVLVAAGSADTVDRRLMVALLDIGPPAALSHRTAAWTWDLPGFLPEPIDVTGLHARTSQGRRATAILHQPRRLFERHLVEVDGLLVTTPTRTIFDLANLPDANPRQIERLLDRAWSRRLLDHRSVASTLADLAGRGRRGIGLMRELLAERPPDYAAAESNLEDRFREILGGYLGGQFRVQVNVRGDTDWIGRVDFIHDRARVVVEVDSTTYHSTISDQRRDRERQAKLEAEGLHVLRVREHDVWHEPAHVADAVRSAVNAGRVRDATPDRTGARDVA